MMTFGRWSGNKIQDYNGTLRFTTKEYIKGWMDNIKIEGMKCYDNNDNEIKVNLIERLVTIPKSEYDELLGVKKDYEDMIENENNGWDGFGEGENDWEYPEWGD